MTGTVGGTAACVAVAALAVGAAQRPAAQNVTTGCVDRYDAAVDYFPDRATIEDATNFTVRYERSYKVLTLKNAPSGVPDRYLLIQCGTPVPSKEGQVAPSQVVTVPLRSLFLHSSTHLSLLDDLARLDALTGVASFDYVQSPAALARVRSGHVIEFAKTALEIDAERVVTARPGALFTGSAATSTMAVIRSAGIPVVGNSDWLETTALGRAEWLKYFALFLNEERKAEIQYAAMKSRYRALSARATAPAAGATPSVMTGRSTRGTFVIAGGRSYVAALIKDAGGRYVWADNTATGAPSIDLEAQLQRARDADVWINGGGWKNLAAMLEDEPRYAQFKAFQTGQVWVYERRQTAAGANDYWSRASSRPDLLLADLVKVFHPALVPAHEFEWYMQVPPK